MVLTIFARAKRRAAAGETNRLGHIEWEAVVNGVLPFQRGAKWVGEYLFGSADNESRVRGCALRLRDVTGDY